MPNGEQPVTLNDEPSDANENEIDYITTRDSLDDVNVVAKSRSERKSNDFIKRIEATEYVRIEIENLDRPDSTTYPEIAGFVQRTEKRCKCNGRKLFQSKRCETCSNHGDDIIVPEISQNDDRIENLSPRGGQYYLRPDPSPNISEDFRY